MSWCQVKTLKNLFMTRQRCTHKLQASWLHDNIKTHRASTRRCLSSKEIRQIFLDYFQTQHGHHYVPSSSIIPKKTEGVYFINAGMNQFKPIFLGNEEPKHKRVTNSQKCIRIGGKHNDLEDVGRDLYHHTFFEMLGSWSFGDYFKREACSMAWDLLTNVYNIPASQLYVTYFAGEPGLCLEADLECKDIWRSLGVAESNIIGSGMRDNFWDMGDTGPCGPCSEIHYDRSNAGANSARKLVNTGSHQVIEIWNLVFMQFNRQYDGRLTALPRQHVDTGMGMERLTALLQHKQSNYDTDLFLPLISAIEQFSKAPQYLGNMSCDDKQLQIDTAYRIIADHIRTITVVLSDGLVPGNDYLQHRVRSIIHRALKAGTTLQCPPNVLSHIMPIVVDSLGDTYPELHSKLQYKQSIVDESEARYRQLRTAGSKAVNKALLKYGTSSRLTGEEAWEIHIGRFGEAIPVDIVFDIAAEKYIYIDEKGFLDKMKEKKERDAAGSLLYSRRSIPPSILSLLQSKNIPKTDDSYKYVSTLTGTTLGFSQVNSSVLAILIEDTMVTTAREGQGCCLILDKTSFYSEAGGQVADKGHIETQNGLVEIEDVQTTESYVVHHGTVIRGHVTCLEQATLDIKQGHRQRCMCNHTATHILNYCLNHVLGDVKQQGSKVTHDKLTFDFSCMGNVDMESLQQIQDMANGIIDADRTVHRKILPFSEARKIPGIRYLDDEEYPPDVYVVSIGAALDDPTQLTVASVEMCGGTHVPKTGLIDRLVVCSLSGVQAGTKSITAVTGDEANKTLQNARELETLLASLESDIKMKTTALKSLVDQEDNIERFINDHILPKVTKVLLMKRFDEAKVKVHESRNRQKRNKLFDELQSLMVLSSGALIDTMKLKYTVKETFKCLASLTEVRPTMLFNTSKKKVTCLCYVPEMYQEKGLLAKDWIMSLGVDDVHCFAGYGFNDSTACVMSGDLDQPMIDKCQQRAREYCNKIDNKTVIISSVE